MEAISATQCVPLSESTGLSWTILFLVHALRWRASKAANRQTDVAASYTWPWKALAVRPGGANAPAFVAKNRYSSLLGISHCKQWNNHCLLFGRPQTLRWLFVKQRTTWLPWNACKALWKHTRWLTTQGGSDHHAWAMAMSVVVKRTLFRPVLPVHSAMLTGLKKEA